ncbi:HepT-like ribonuclease domain-containing protein [Oscillospiraceae bacterium 21-37]|uniref:HepT-like ribonuclease domain-containing protein n=1 Tax=Acutalibacter sp. JLR.KK004 TaxID=3112622 RepID=UPI002170944B|nr:DUF86 domain-containing protein [Acutalibacter sp.]
MNSKDMAVLKKILHHIESIIRYCSDCRSLESFSSDTMRLEATVFNLMQIGELAKVSLSDEAKAQIRTIPWQQIYGMRNRIVHGYSGVNMQIVWDTVSEDIPSLRKELELFMESNT